MKKYNKVEFMQIMNTLTNYDEVVDDISKFLKKQSDKLNTDFFTLMGEAMQTSYTPFTNIITALLDNMYDCDDLISWWYDEVFFWKDNDGVKIKEHGNEYKITCDVETLWNVLEKEYM